MPDYIVKYRGHIVEDHRSEGFPRYVERDLVVRVNDLEGLKNATNAGLVQTIRNNGMIVLKDNSKVHDGDRFEPDAQIFVPLHMISYVETITNKIVGDIPDDVSENILQ